MATPSDTPSVSATFSDIDPTGWFLPEPTESDDFSHPFPFPSHHTGVQLNESLVPWAKSCRARYYDGDAQLNENGRRKYESVMGGTRIVSISQSGIGRV
jgi:hypothetical protein